MADSKVEISKIVIKISEVEHSLSLEQVRELHRVLDDLMNKHNVSAVKPNVQSTEDPIGCKHIYDIAWSQNHEDVIFRDVPWGLWHRGLKIMEFKFCPLCGIDLSLVDKEGMPNCRRPDMTNI
jgi:hypothetical protein